MARLDLQPDEQAAEDGGELPTELDAPTERSRHTILAFVAAALLLVGGPAALSRVVSQPEGQEFVFVIPAGTAARLAAGEQVEVLPADLNFALQDRLIFLNEDSEVHRVGPFTVAPGERLTQRFSSVATISGFCSLHPSNQIEIKIRPQA